MTLVHITKNWDWPELVRQTPSSKGMWDGIQFTLEPVEECDYVIVLNRVPQDTTVRCRPEHVWAIIQEPPNEVFEDLHWGDVRYYRVYTQHLGLRSKRYIHSQPALPWHVNRGYDYLKGCGVPTKERRLSCISSDKAFLEGHRARLQFLERLRQHVKFDLFGRGFSPIQDKWDGLAPFRYSLAIENFRNPYYWSEKLSDCFLAWTMPIYHGCTRIGDYFPAEAMVCIDIDDPMAVERVRETISSDLYTRNFDAIAYARELVLERYQLFPFIAQQIKDHENIGSCNLSRPQTILLTHRLRPPVNVKVRLATQRYGRRLGSRLRKMISLGRRLASLKEAK